jgi:hypothetical protein
MPIPAAAQMVVINDDSVVVRDTDGDAAATLDSQGDLELGGLGRNGDIRLLDVEGDQTVTIDGNTGNITLGGGNDDGDISLLDSDGTTSTIYLNGQLGQITLGNSGSNEDGDITVRNSAGGTSFEVDGATGTATNDLDGNGLVKGWARMGDDGTLVSCWRCSTNTAHTKRISEGQYTVDFPSLGDDITTRPFVCSIAHGNLDETDGVEFLHVVCTAANGDPSKVYVQTFRYNDDDIGNDFGVVYRDSPFTVVIY